MQTITLEAQSRELGTNGKLKDLRKQGWIPAIVYGDQAKKTGKKVQAQANTLLKLNEKSFLKMLGTHQASNLIFELKVSGQTANAVIKEIQRDPVSRQMIHVDFQRINMSEKLQVLVPIHLLGEAPGVKLNGGILEHITREVKISVLPKDMPEAINVDISGLQIGNGVLVSQLPQLPGVEILADPHQIVVNVVAQAVIEETPAAAAAPTAAEPEVIAKGKKPEEGEAAAAAPAGKGAAAAPAKGEAKPGK